MKNILTNTTKTAYKWIVFGTFFWLTVFSVAYAASIRSTTDPTVSTWDSITASWYQDVNDKIWGLVNDGWTGGSAGISINDKTVWWKKYSIISTSDSNWSMWWWKFSILDGSVVWNNSKQSRLTIDWVGNVGIGTSSPSNKLEVNWTIWIKTESTATSNIESTGNAWALLRLKTNWANRLKLHSDSSWARIWTVSSQDLQVVAWWEYATKLTVKHDTGNVWIWTTTPKAKLDVNWSINNKLGKSYYYAGQWFTRNSYNFSSTPNTLSNTVITDWNAWRVVFQWSWMEDYFWGGFPMEAPYFEVTSDNPVVSVWWRTLTISRNTTTWYLEATSNSNIWFNWTVNVYTTPDSLWKEWNKSIRVEGNINTNGIISSKEWRMKWWTINYTKWSWWVKLFDSWHTAVWTIYVWASTWPYNEWGWTLTSDFKVIYWSPNLHNTTHTFNPYVTDIALRYNNSWYDAEVNITSTKDVTIKRMFVWMWTWSFN